MIAEHNGESVVPLTYNTISAARELGGDVTTLVAGPDCGKVLCVCDVCSGTLSEEYMCVLCLGRDVQCTCIHMYNNYTCVRTCIHDNRFD